MLTNISGAELGKYLGLTAVSVAALNKQGVLTRNEKGYSLAESFQSYLRYKTKTGTDVERLAKAKADLAEIDVERKNVELIPTALCQNVCDKIVSEIAKGLDGLPNTLAAQIVNVSTVPEAKQILTKAIDKVRKDLSNPDLYQLGKDLIDKENDRKSKYNPH